jgi:hypothetical protein
VPKVSQRSSEVRENMFAGMNQLISNLRGNSNHCKYALWRGYTEPRGGGYMRRCSLCRKARRRRPKAQLA